MHRPDRCLYTFFSARGFIIVPVQMDDVDVIAAYAWLVNNCAAVGYVREAAFRTVFPQTPIPPRFIALSPSSVLFDVICVFFSHLLYINGHLF
jgi:hypothetical protein